MVPSRPGHLMRRDSSSSSATPPPLDYLQPNPVRGQLEPHDELTRKSGCRFLQCTDTPDELKVLLPPRTAQIYTLLLKAELAELGKQRDASWERILDIRRLKDRMIRKCQRLARAYSINNPGTREPFLTLHAPPDFRVKEMEKWIRRQEGSDVLKRLNSPGVLRQRGSFCCDRCANLVPHHHTISSRRSSVQSAHTRRSSTSEKLPPKGPVILKRPSISVDDKKGVIPRSPSPNKFAVVNRNIIQHTRDQETHAEGHTTLHASNHFQESVTSEVASFVEEHTQVHTSMDKKSASIDRSRSATESNFQGTKRSIHTIVEDPQEFHMDHGNHSYVKSHSDVESLERLSIISPDPLPVPYHGSTSATFMEICDSPVDMTQPETNKLRQKDSSAEDSTPSPPSEDEPTTDGISRLDMPRRRSSLKRSNSELRMSMAYSTKTVSWAMDRDWAHQMEKYHAAAAQVDHADEEWRIVCEKYQEDLAGLKALRRNVTQTLSKLRIETEKLQREDEVIRDQEEKIRQGYEQLQEQHVQYREKVKTVLQETEQVLTLCGTKRDGELQRP